ncbi:MAG: hypothetical protein JWM25_67 [Thermoleophilia bacterium]|nr:hypothetical protein [Thermoleophilia bacterium]MCZ4495484.1 hypothetical protein [Thermoleophilia bacterium]
MRHPHPKSTGVLIAVASIALAGCGGSAEVSAGPGSAERSGDSRAHAFPLGDEPVQLDPADFSTDIDNPYWPMRVGNRWVYEETDATGNRGQVVVEVTDRTKKIANGITARVVRDTATEDGVPVEITDDWYAQDSTGTIWYLGEYVTNYEDGKPVDHDGSFEAGVDGALPGVIMPAQPRPGMSYRQEYYKGEAEDNGAIITVDQEQVEVPFGFFKNVLMTRDLSATEPKVQELKFYVKGVGPLLSMHTDGDGERAELVEFTDATARD